MERVIHYGSIVQEHTYLLQLVMMNICLLLSKLIWLLSTLYSYRNFNNIIARRKITANRKRH